MKKLIMTLLVLLLVAFLVVTNPTSEEYAQWYTEQSFPVRDNVLDEMMGQFTQHMAQSALREDYLVASVFSYEGHKTLGVALMFYPLDELNSQVQAFRADYAAWLEEQTTVPESTTGS